MLEILILLDLLYYFTLLVCSIEDIRSGEISGDIFWLMISLAVIKNSIEDSQSRVNPIGIVTAILVLYIIGIIGGGDAKIFIASVLYLRGRELQVISCILISLAAELILSKRKKKTPLTSLFAISMLSINLMNIA
ncbi:MAG: hypothetical protein NDP13_04670 [Crenarchaeota archaeon]|nr:hypothetical protein [Thermoproteota archaeon]MCR8454266.1 hypothetical protein [Thermoproteota archaeon]MCR8455034.1 hypothetical protein [Thermoproteota archaeon]MCR8463243.1 hypothetical protein [Thermoproteota archaeon]MCR8470482.1 hypothetical protein [Thermoproteota archaeon]